MRITLCQSFEWRNVVAALEPFFIHASRYLTDHLTICHSRWLGDILRDFFLLFSLVLTLCGRFHTLRSTDGILAAYTLTVDGSRLGDNPGDIASRLLTDIEYIVVPFLNTTTIITDRVLDLDDFHKKIDSGKLSLLLSLSLTMVTKPTSWLNLILVHVRHDFFSCQINNGKWHVPSSVVKLTMASAFFCSQINNGTCRLL